MPRQQQQECVVDFRVGLIRRRLQNSVVLLQSLVRYLWAWTLCRSYRLRSLQWNNGKKRQGRHLLQSKIPVDCLR